MNLNVNQVTELILELKYFEMRFKSKLKLLKEKMGLTRNIDVGFMMEE